MCALVERERVTKHITHTHTQNVDIFANAYAYFNTVSTVTFCYHPYVSHNGDLWFSEMWYCQGVGNFLLYFLCDAKIYYITCMTFILRCEWRRI